ncbi:2-amino-4-hydroxy-6-hydroxymethyldihydropteridine diphosphokinase [Pseudoalteromonas luteoviolacea]|uniref:2-amino-4-hydroxy-6- hydroxymethyldihydropteridine diphosphokinase n=1 Tax=Pseudoalteromonas luteoviolacea TaxID=43657 RepID=UPI001B36DB38|nr:2-amino-4-hydroxy-6-hydroxymethyldihydropteridine diphosphokinase [Pseudoalteromonas luteoviolacea]MBQ4813550.1 2-amino-4-hydroxy-6-hydroxymethyldihydropteridine diphosphokinase [Pseudoalteromonas luteoviolacea]
MAEIYISIGSNVDRERHFKNGLTALIEHFPDYVHSNVYESEPVGFSGRNFFNSVFAAKTTKSVEQVCQILKQIEQDNGRTRSDKKFSPRTLDLDLLMYDGMICDKPAQLPRDEIIKNAFVLLPLSEVAAEVVHPVVGEKINAIWQNYHNPSQKLWKVEL